MKNPKKILLIFSILLLCIVSDQITKNIVRSDLPRTKPLILVNGILSLNYVDNKGGVFASE